MKGNLIIISSPSGGGKGTLIREVLEKVPHVGYSISHTTRSPRSGEESGKHYHFVSRAEFDAYRDQGGFLEYAEVHGNYYGTTLKQTERITESGSDVILEIDVQGAATVMEKMPEAVSIFIMPPSFEVLRARLTARATERMDDLELRLKNSLGEVMHFSNFGYVVVNDEITAASNKIATIILAERQRPHRQGELIKGILGSFERAKL
ncbi:MAG: guanylate kinase [Acidobacteria bacterium]|nr:MAG: guanylate kinase [Acidobacteriota bacterium]